MNLQCVKNQDIKKIYSPREYFKFVNSKQDLTKIEKVSKKLCKLFIELGDIPENRIGITGSPMIGLNTEKSDIDIILYGTQTSLQFQEKLQNIFKKNNHVRKYNLDEYKKHYEWRVGGSDILFQDFLKSEQRKLHQGKYQGVDFFIRYIKSPRDWEGDYYDYQYKNMGRISLIAEITNSTDSIFTPCSYKIKCSKVLVSDTNINNRMNVITQINSYRGRFCEQAKDGEKVLVEGKIEKVNYRDSEFFRILLTDQTLDKMIIID
jgi:predicted nucleotidyltransferase